MTSRSGYGGLSALTVGLLTVAGIQAQTTPTYPGITYATYSTSPGALDCKLDVYIPTVGTPPYPVLIYVHGGGWSSGSRSATGYVPIDVLAQGIASVAIDYRLTSQAHQFGMVNGIYVPVTWPAQIHDCKAAIRWVRGNAATYGFDPNRIGVFGPSAGGHLVAAMGTMGGITSYTRGSQTIDMEGTVGNYDNLSSQVMAVCDFYGPTDILYMNQDVTFPPGCVFDFDAIDSPTSYLVGSNAYSLGVGQVRSNLNNTTAPYPFLAATTISANPITFIRPGMPPMFIMHGDVDSTVPIKQSVRLRDALLASGNVAKYTVVPNAGHGGFGSTYIAATVSWIAGVLKGTLVCPGITTQPIAQTVAPGNTATFTIAATGTSLLTYQWQKNSANITNGGHYSGCTTATLTISSTDNGDVTNYRCMVTNTGGTVASNQAALTLKPLVAADLDGDCDVDQADFNLFAACISGPTVPLNTGCQSRDFDDDNDVDQADFGFFQRCISGENITGDPHCAD